MLQLGAYPLYSVDASALIDFKEYYPPDVLPSMWNFVGDLADQRRLLICEEVDGQCEDDELRELIDSRPGMVVQFAHIDHLRSYEAEADSHNIQLVDPNRTTDWVDPYVVALALMLDSRDAADLQCKLDTEAECVVVTHENRRGAGAGLAKIPDVCGFYGLTCIRWPALLRREGYRA